MPDFLLMVCNYQIQAPEKNFLPNPLAGGKVYLRFCVLCYNVFSAAALE